MKQVNLLLMSAAMTLAACGGTKDTPGNNKQTRKCQQYLSVLLQWILLFQHLMVALKKKLLFALGQIL